MGLFKFLVKWSLQITGSLIVGYNYVLKPEQQANLYGFYRSCHNSYHATKLLYSVLNQYKSLAIIKNKPEQYNKRLTEINLDTAKGILQLSRINKGVYMRMGQYLGHLKHAFPQQFYKILKQLNQNPQYQILDYKYLKKHIQNQLGKKTKQIFESLDTSPIKSELFYQIYKAELSKNFLDVSLKVIYPYASTEAKYDFWFLTKAFDFVKKFKDKNFNNTYPLCIDILYQNLKSSVEKELNTADQQKTTLQIKQMLKQLVEQQKNSVRFHRFPVYAPHLYSQYTKRCIVIQEYFNGYHFSNLDAILKQNYNKKSVAFDLVEIWNKIIQRNKIIIESWTPEDLLIRKSRKNQEGPYQICPLNLAQVKNIPNFFIQPYLSLWKEFISNKKINPKKPEERTESIRKFYDNLSQVYFCFFLQQKQSLAELCQKSNISVDPSVNLVDLAIEKLPKQVVKKLEQKKLLPISKSKKLKNISLQSQQAYNNLKRAFQIDYQPWKLQIPFQTYKQIFRDQKNFGIF